MEATYRSYGLINCEEVTHNAKTMPRRSLSPYHDITGSPQRKCVPHSPLVSIYGYEIEFFLGFFHLLFTSSFIHILFINSVCHCKPISLHSFELFLHILSLPFFFPVSLVSIRQHASLEHPISVLPRGISSGLLEGLQSTCNTPKRCLQECQRLEEGLCRREGPSREVQRRSTLRVLRLQHTGQCRACRQSQRHKGSSRCLERSLYMIYRKCGYLADTLE